MKYYIVSGGFDPLHEGHIAMIHDAACRCDGVIVLLNSDEWLIRKKGRAFMSWQSRAAVCSYLKNVIGVLPFDDADNSACAGLKLCREHYPLDELVFANGGDRTPENIPESAVANSLDIVLEFGIGGADKKNSSSWILKRWQQHN